ncbi:MAG: hypothetical protein HW373_1784 [Deltaproteobacteria bacterium]|nr:hypothetical protein [Deltaproteobacteria bacterium]
MAKERSNRVLLIHPDAIINYLNEFLASFLDDDDEILRSCIQRILQQFLHNGFGALDDFAGCNLVGEMFRKYLYFIVHYYLRN